MSGQKIFSSKFDRRQFTNYFSGITSKPTLIDSETDSVSHLPTIGLISLNKSNIKEHFEKQNKVVQKAFGRSIILSPPNFDSHPNRHLVNSKKCGRSAVINLSYR